MVCDFKATLSMYQLRTLFIHIFVNREVENCLHVVNYIRSTDMNIFTDLSSRMRQKLFEKPSFSIVSNDSINCLKSFC